MPRCTYLMPLRRSHATKEQLAQLQEYAREVTALGCEVLIVDGSPPCDFNRHHEALADVCRHVPLDRRWRYLNGKVNGVLTGISLASCDRVVIADDDVVYGATEIERMCELLEAYELIVPQNYFNRLPWWARIETGRILINRALRAAGDYPGTFGVLRSSFMRVGPYDGDVLFENEEMRRHFLRNGARVYHARDFWIARRPPTLRKWREQRVRQAYEDLDSRLKTAIFLAILPVGLAAGAAFGAWLAALYTTLLVSVLIGLAIAGRRDGGAGVIPVGNVISTPLWVLERSVTVYAALWARCVTGGCEYGGRLIARGVGRAQA